MVDAFTETKRYELKLAHQGYQVQTHLAVPNSSVAAPVRVQLSNHKAIFSCFKLVARKHQLMSVVKVIKRFSAVSKL